MFFTVVGSFVGKVIYRSVNLISALLGGTGAYLGVSYGVS